MPDSWTMRMSSRMRSGPVLVDGARREPLVARRPAADRLQERLGILAEQREQEQLLLARRQPSRLRAELLEHGRRLGLAAVRSEELHGPFHHRVDLPGRPPVAAEDEVAELVHDDDPALGREDVEERLRGEHLSDGSGEGRHPDLETHACELVEDLVDPVPGRVRAEVRVEPRDEPRGQGELGGADGDPRGERRHGVVADVLVDELRGTPQGGAVDTGVHSQSGERRGERLAGDAVERQGHRVHRRRQQVGSGPRGLDRARERRTARALEVHAHREAARLLQAVHEVAGAAGLERAGRVVEEHPRRAELRQPPRALHERLRLARHPRAVDEAAVELAPGRGDRLCRLGEVRDVVQRVVEPEDVDAVRGRGRDEPLDEVGGDGVGTDEEAAAQRHPERRLHAALQGADALPGALHAPAHGRVEDAAAGHLEVREPGAVEDVGELQHLGGRHAPRERLLPEEADGRVGQSRHRPGD